MDTVKLTESQLRDVVKQTIAEALDEVNWFQRAGNGIRNAWDNAKTQVGGAAAGLKAGIKHGGLNAASVGRNDYLANKNNELAQGRQQEADAAIAEFKKEYGQKVGELNRWKANEIRQIKQMYGADAFAKKAGNAATSAEATRQNQAAFWTPKGQAAGQNNAYRRVDESINKIVDEVIKKITK